MHKKVSRRVFNKFMIWSPLSKAVQGLAHFKYQAGQNKDGESKFCTFYLIIKYPVTRIGSRNN